MSETIQWKIKRFNELSAIDLYELLQLRSDVFVVEQNCVYQDIDGKDSKAIHLIGEFDEKIVGYARLFDSGHYFPEASIGRVVMAAQYRDRKWGHDLMREAIAAIKSEFGKSDITISAQLYLKKFYEQHSFVVFGDGYDEDGIPHIQMRRKG